jgi:hypothetical protein
MDGESSVATNIYYMVRMSTVLLSERMELDSAIV